MRVLSVVLFSLLVSACAVPKPVEVVSGEACWRCRRPIENTKLAGELMASNGLASKFRSVHCMATWIGQQATPAEGRYYVTDFATGKFVPAEKAVFVHTIVNRNTMERDFLAFASRDDAAKIATADNTPIVDWSAVLQKGKTEPMGGN